MSGGGGALKHRTEPPPLHRDQALFLDFDGTLVEIAPAPSLVRVPAELPQLLGELADRLVRLRVEHFLRHLDGVLH